MQVFGREAEEKNYRRIELAGTVYHVPGKHHRVHSRPLCEWGADDALSPFSWHTLSLPDFPAGHRASVSILLFRGGCV